MATRIANSCRRALIRASSRFERLTQAIASTQATAPASTEKAGRKLPRSASFKRRHPRAERAAVVDRLLEPLADGLEIGLRLRRRHARISGGRCRTACSPPGRLRADRERREEIDLVARARRSHRSRTTAGSTPTIVTGSLFRVSAWPDDVGVAAETAAPERVAEQRDRCRPNRHSSAVKFRPSSGRTPRTSRKLSETPTVAQPLRLARAGQRLPSSEVEEREVRRPAPRSSVFSLAPRLERVGPRGPRRQTAGALVLDPRQSVRVARTGSGRSRTALTMLNIAVHAPMPSASVSSATAANPATWRAAEGEDDVRTHGCLDVADVRGVYCCLPIADALGSV